MANEQKRIAIAIWCKTPQLAALLADEQTALYAMHEAEKSLNLPQCERYWDELLSMCGPSRMIHASASVRADAFLKAIRKL